MHWRMVEHGMEFGWLFIVIFSIFIVLGVIHLVNSIGDKKKEKTYEGSPLHILKKRYAKGEIAREEFEKMKNEFTTK